MEVDLAKSWERYKGSAVSRIAAITVGLISFIALVALYWGSSSDGFDELDLLLGAIWSIAVVLVSYLLMLGISWGRKGPFPAIYENGVLLVRPTALRLGTCADFYAYRELEVQRRTATGLWVRSMDGQSWSLPERVFGGEWLRKVEERARHPPAGAVPPRLVLYPKPGDRQNDGGRRP